MRPLMKLITHSNARIKVTNRIHSIQIRKYMSQINKINGRPYIMVITQVNRKLILNKIPI